MRLPLLPRLSRLPLLLGLLAILGLGWPTEGGAGRNDPGAGVETPATAELLVFEIDGCRYCAAFRDNLGARYQSSTTHRAAPLRYVDIARAESAAAGLVRDITIAPTIVLMQDGQEVARIEGYPPPEVLFGLVRGHLPAAGAGAVE